MPVTADGEVLEDARPRAPGRASRTVRIGGELVTVPLRPADQRRRLVWPLAEPIYRSLAKKTGASFATDRTLQAMIYRDTGHVVGDRSIARARRREAKRGTITSQRIKPNRIAGTVRTYAGTVRVRFVDIAEKRKAQWLAKIEQRKRRREEHLRAKAEARAKEIVRRPPPPPGREELVPMRAVTGLAEVLASLQVRAPVAGAGASSPAPDAAARARALEVERQTAAVRALDLDAPKKPEP